MDLAGIGTKSRCGMSRPKISMTRKTLDTKKPESDEATWAHAVIHNIKSRVGPLLYAIFYLNLGTERHGI